MNIRILLDTNIIIHREAATAVRNDIGILFKWLDNLHYTKCIHPITVAEIQKHEDPSVKASFRVKLGNYNVLKTQAPLTEKVKTLCVPLDKNEHDCNDTKIINELAAGRVDILITEDKNLLKKAGLLVLSDRVYKINQFLEKVNRENPELTDYKVLAVKKVLLGNLDIADSFFDSFKEDYPCFEEWFNRKADETSYVCFDGDKISAVLYIKPEKETEDYSDISPGFNKMKRLKISTFKVGLNGYRLGERFLKIVFDNAFRFKVSEIYVTIYNKRPEQQKLIELLEEYGFKFHGHKDSRGGQELVYVRALAKTVNYDSPKLTYPFFSRRGRFFFVPIYPSYHTELFPDSILNTESPMDYVENFPHRNAISKVYISRSYERGLSKGDIIVFYRTGGYYEGVVTTLGIVENTIDGILNKQEFIQHCRKRSVFTDAQLSEQWDHSPSLHPFIVNFLYLYSFNKRINLKRLIELNIIKDINSVPRGFMLLSSRNVNDILKECFVDESIIVN